MKRRIELTNIPFAAMCSIFNETNFNLCQPANKRMKRNSAPTKNIKCTVHRVLPENYSNRWHTLICNSRRRARHSHETASNASRIFYHTFRSMHIKHFNLSNIILRFHLKTSTSGTTRMFAFFSKLSFHQIHPYDNAQGSRLTHITAYETNAVFKAAKQRQG